MSEHSCYYKNRRWIIRDATFCTFCLPQSVEQCILSVSYMSDTGKLLTKFSRCFEIKMHWIDRDSITLWQYLVLTVLLTSKLGWSHVKYFLGKRDKVNDFGSFYRAMHLLIASFVSQSSATFGTLFFLLCKWIELNFKLSLVWRLTPAPLFVKLLI